MSEWPKYEKEMWCFNCEHEWITDDYLNCNKCPSCITEPIRIYRTDSTAIVYAQIERSKPLPLPPGDK